MTTMIRCVVSTLNDIEVKGRDNLDKLLGCIMTLEGIAQAMEQPPAGEKEKNVKTQEATKTASVTKIHGEAPQMENINTEVADG